jgi:hypothetical protein
MKPCGALLFATLFVSLAFTSSASGAVAVSRPAGGSTVSSPVNFVATANTSTCSRGVASMGIYVNNHLTYVVNGSSLNTAISLGPGNYNTVVEEWDYCGGATFTAVPIAVTAQTGVWVTAPANNSTVGSPVQFVASASTATCARGVASMGVYFNDQLTYVTQGNSLNTSLFLTPGTYNAVVEEWDYCGGATFTPLRIVVPGTLLSGIQASGGWVGYGEFPPLYAICSACGSGVTYSLQQGIASPSLSGRATRFNLGGITPYADVLWTNPLIGDFSTQGKPDTAHTLLPTIYNFTYDAYFYGADLETSQALEFDVSQYFNGLSLIFGHQCRIAGGHEWDVWDNVHQHWIPTGIPCHPQSNAWNHMAINAQRTSNNWLYFKSITLNGVTSYVNWYFPPGTAPSSWYGITVNFQTDGNDLQAPYSVLVDKLNFIYW